MRKRSTSKENIHSIFPTLRTVYILFHIFLHSILFLTNLKNEFIIMRYEVRGKLMKSNFKWGYLEASEFCVLSSQCWWNNTNIIFMWVWWKRRGSQKPQFSVCPTLRIFGPEFLSFESSSASLSLSQLLKVYILHTDSIEFFSKLSYNRKIKMTRI